MELCGESRVQVCSRVWTPSLITAQWCLVVPALFPAGANARIIICQITPASAEVTLQPTGLIEERFKLLSYKLLSYEAINKP